MESFELNPITKAEQRIYDLLTSRGIEEIEFDNVFNKPERFFRIGYWKRLPDDLLHSLRDDVKECVHYDDDCGHLFLYEMKESMK